MADVARCCFCGSVVDVRPRRFWQRRERPVKHQTGFTTCPGYSVYRQRFA